MAENIKIVASVGAETAGAVAEVDKLKKSIDEVGGSTKKTGKETQAAGGHFGKLKEGLSQMIPGFDGVSEGASKATTSFKALIATPVGFLMMAIAAAIGLVIKALSTMQPVVNKVEQVMAYLGGAFDAVVQVVADFISSIKSAGDFLTKISQIISNPAMAFQALGKTVDAAAKATMRLKEEQQKLARDQVNNIAKNKDLIKQEEALKNIRDNEFNKIGERIAANEEAAKLEKQRLTTLEALQLREVARLTELVNLKGGVNKVSLEQLKELREAELGLADIREESIGRENEFITERFGLQKEAEEKAKAAADAAAARAKDAADKAAAIKKQYADLEAEIDLESLKRGKNRFEIELIDLNIEYQKKLDLAKGNALLIEKVENDLALKKVRIQIEADAEAARLRKEQEAKDKIAQLEADRMAEIQAAAKTINLGLLVNRNAKLSNDVRLANEKAMTDAILELSQKEAEGKINMQNAVASVAGQLSDIVGKQTAVGKGLAIAQALINTYQGIAAGVKLGFPAAIPAVLAASVTGFKAVKSIVSVKVPGQGGGGSVPSAASISAPVLPTQTSTGINQSSINAIGNAAQGGVNRSYILDADYRNSNERNSRLMRAARI